MNVDGLCGMALYVKLWNDAFGQFVHIHGGESRDLNDRVHGISCRYSDKTSKQNLSHFS